jgi:hypothetical protein
VSTHAYKLSENQKTEKRSLVHTAGKYLHIVEQSRTTFDTIS